LKNKSKGHAFFVLPNQNTSRLCDACTYQPTLEGYPQGNVVVGSDIGTDDIGNDASTASRMTS